MCHFPEVRSTFFNHDVSNDMNFWSIHWVTSMIFVNSHFDFLPRKWEEANQEKRLESLALASKFRTPRPTKWALSDRNRGPKEGPIPGLG